MAKRSKANGSMPQNVKAKAKAQKASSRAQQEESK